jgi:hypothetical protein
MNVTGILNILSLVEKLTPVALSALKTILTAFQGGQTELKAGASEKEQRIFALCCQLARELETA